MNFTVTWLPIAERQLAKIWLETAEQAALSLSANEIDRRLGGDPANEGESRSGNNRIIIAPPLVVTFRVNNADRLVQVTNVRHYDPGPRKG